MASSTFPDHRLATYTDDGRLEIGRWMRLEMIVDDFLAFISEFGPVSDEQRRLVRELGPANEGSYDRDLSHWFTADHLDLMYRSNPVWAELERRLYGGLLSLE
jgi:hypothetical protein